MGLISDQLRWSLGPDEDRAMWWAERFVIWAIIMLVTLTLFAITRGILRSPEVERVRNLPRVLIYKEKGEVIEWQQVFEGSLKHSSGFLGGVESGRIRLAYRDKLKNYCVEYRMGTSSVLLISEIENLGTTKKLYGLKGD